MIETRYVAPYSPVYICISCNNSVNPFSHDTKKCYEYKLLRLVKDQRQKNG